MLHPRLMHHTRHVAHVRRYGQRRLRKHLFVDLLNPRKSTTDLKQTLRSLNAQCAVGLRQVLHATLYVASGTLHGASAPTARTRCGTRRRSCRRSAARPSRSRLHRVLTPASGTHACIGYSRLHRVLTPASGTNGHETPSVIVETRVPIGTSGTHACIGYSRLHFSVWIIKTEGTNSQD
jgi:hypothetical protein